MIPLPPMQEPIFSESLWSEMTQPPVYIQPEEPPKVPEKKTNYAALGFVALGAFMAYKILMKGE